MFIDSGSARITVDRTGSDPGVGFRPSNKSAVLHLTRNAAQIIADDPKATDKSTSAITITGQVDVQSDSPQPMDLQGWKFHFIQLAMLRELSAVFAGRTSSEGSVEINFWVPPLIPDDFYLGFCLDSFPGTIPFINFDPAVVLPLPGGNGRLRVSNDMDDHPRHPLPLKLPNTKTRAENFLFKADCDIEFLTAFVAVDPSYKPGSPGGIVSLAHVAWRVTWKAQLKWFGGTPSASMLGKRFDVEKPVLGEPDDAEVADLITNPPTEVSETANAVGENARNQIDHGSAFNLIVNGRWPSYVPQNFFK